MMTNDDTIISHRIYWDLLDPEKDLEDLWDLEWDLEDLEEDLEDLVGSSKRSKRSIVNYKRRQVEFLPVP